MGLVSFFHGCFLALLIFSFVLQAYVSSCPDDWMAYETNCYKFFQDFLPWLQAEVDCKYFSSKSHLASIKDEKEMRKISEWLLPLHMSQPIWIGLYHQEGRRHRYWRWSDLSRSEYTNWNKTGDNCDPNKNCVVMAYFAGALKWYAENCSLPFNYLCEM